MPWTSTLTPEPSVLFSASKKGGPVSRPTLPASVVPRANTTIMSEQPLPKLAVVLTPRPAARVCSPTVMVLLTSLTAMLAGKTLVMAPRMELTSVVLRDEREAGGGRAAAGTRRGRRMSPPMMEVVVNRIVSTTLWCVLCCKDLSVRPVSMMGGGRQQPFRTSFSES
jgi:hypothetical protein